MSLRITTSKTKALDLIEDSPRYTCMMYNNGIILGAVINLSACVDISFCLCWFVEHYRSGSMAGQKLSILKLAAMSLLETLQENDFVNIVVMVSNLNWNQTSHIWYK